MNKQAKPQKMVYRPKNKFELHLHADTLAAMNIIGIANKRYITDIKKVSDEELKTLLSMTMSAQNALAEEYFRRNPQEREKYESMCNPNEQSS